MSVKRPASYKAKRTRYLERNSNCALCGEMATTVDHIVPLWTGVFHCNDQTNWQPLCKRCHQAKNQEDDLHEKVRKMSLGQFKYQAMEYLCFASVRINKAETIYRAVSGFKGKSVKRRARKAMRRYEVFMFFGMDKWGESAGNLLTGNEHARNEDIIHLSALQETGQVG